MSFSYSTPYALWQTLLSHDPLCRRAVRPLPCAPSHSKLRPAAPPQEPLCTPAHATEPSPSLRWWCCGSATRSARAATDGRRWVRSLDVGSADAGVRACGHAVTRLPTLASAAAACHGRRMPVGCMTRQTHVTPAAGGLERREAGRAASAVPERAAQGGGSQGGGLPDPTYVRLTRVPRALAWSASLAGQSQPGCLPILAACPHTRTPGGGLQLEPPLPTTQDA